MGDQYQGGAAFLVELEQQVADALAGQAVEVARRLIGKQHRGLGGKGPGDGHPLLLAARQLARRVAQALAQADALQQLTGVFARIAPAFKLQRQHDVLQRVEAVEQLERLKHEADVFGADLGALVFIERGEVLAGQDDRAGAGPVKAGEQAEQGRFSRTRGADDGQAVALGQGQ